ncbi:MAG: hypothetical protein L0I76_27330 [Pseudonocardia sp.]|nr:hypothetical protein [Pseudonocardia sp.]
MIGYLDTSAFVPLLLGEPTSPACDDELVRAAADLARTRGPRGYDALHCAAAPTLADDDLVAAAGDRVLLRAWRNVGVATYDTSEQ